MQKAFMIKQRIKMKLPPEPLLLGVFIYNSAAVFCCSQLYIGSDVILLPPDIHCTEAGRQARPPR